MKSSSPVHRKASAFAASIEKFEEEAKEDAFVSSLKKVRAGRHSSAASVLENRWDNYVTDTRKAFISKPQQSLLTTAVAGTGAEAESSSAVEDWDYADLRQSYISLYHLVRNLDDITDQSLRDFTHELSQPVKHGLLNSISLNHQSNEFSSALQAVDLTPRLDGDIEMSADAKLQLYVDGDKKNVMRSMEKAKERAAQRSQKMNSSFQALREALDGTIQRVISRYERESGIFKLQTKCAEDDAALRRLKASLTEKNFIINMHKAQAELSVVELRKHYESSTQQHVATLLRLIRDKSERVDQALQLQQENEKAIHSLEENIGHVLHAIEKEERKAAVDGESAEENTIQQFRASLYRHATATAAHRTAVGASSDDPADSAGRREIVQQQMRLFHDRADGIITEEDVADAQEAVLLEQSRLDSINKKIDEKEQNIAANIAAHMKLLRSERCKALERLKTMTVNLRAKNEADAKRITVLQKIQVQLDKEREQFRKDDIRSHVQRLTRKETVASPPRTSDYVAAADESINETGKGGDPKKVVDDDDDDDDDVPQLPSTTVDIVKHFDPIQTATTETASAEQQVGDKLQRMKFAMYRANPRHTVPTFDTSESSEDGDGLGQLLERREQRKSTSRKRRSTTSRSQEKRHDPELLHQQRRYILPKQHHKVEQIKHMFDDLLVDISTSKRPEVKYIFDPLSITTTTKKNPYDDSSLVVSNSNRTALPHRPSITPAGAQSKQSKDTTSNSSKNENPSSVPLMAAAVNAAVATAEAQTRTAANDLSGHGNKMRSSKHWRIRSRQTFVASSFDASDDNLQKYAAGTAGTNKDSERREDGSFRSTYVVPGSALQEEEDADIYEQNHGLKLAVEQMSSFLNALNNWSSSHMDEPVKSDRLATIASTDEGATLLTIGNRRAGSTAERDESNDEMLTVDALRQRKNALEKKINSIIKESSIKRQMRKDLKREIDAAEDTCEQLRNQLISMVDNVRWPAFFKAGQLQLELEERQERVQSLKLKANQLEQSLMRKRQQNVRLSELITHDLETHQRKMARSTMRASSQIYQKQQKQAPALSPTAIQVKHRRTMLGETVDEFGVKIADDNQFTIAPERVAIFDDMEDIYEHAARDVHAAPDRLTPEPPLRPCEANKLETPTVAMVNDVLFDGSALEEKDDAPGSTPQASSVLQEMELSTPTVVTIAGAANAASELEVVASDRGVGNMQQHDHLLSSTDHFPAAGCDTTAAGSEVSVLLPENSSTFSHPALEANEPPVHAPPTPTVSVSDASSLMERKSIHEQVVTQLPFQTSAAPRTSIRSMLRRSSLEAKSKRSSANKSRLITSSTEYKLEDFNTPKEGGEEQLDNRDDDSDDGDDEVLSSKRLYPPLVSFIPSSLFVKQQQQQQQQQQEEEQNH